MYRRETESIVLGTAEASPVDIVVPGYDSFPRCNVMGVDHRGRRFRIAPANVRLKEPTTIGSVPEPSFERFSKKDTSGSFSRIKKSGAVKMTPLSHVNRSTQHFAATIDTFRVERSGIYADGVGVGVNDKYRWLGIYSVDPVVVRTSVEADLAGFRHLGNIPHFQMRLPDIQNNLERLKLELIANHSQQYDVLTDIGELSSTIRTGLQLLSNLRRPLEAMKKVRDEHRRKGTRASADLVARKWLEVQYGILPVYYSSQDLLKHIRDNTGNRYLTTRKRFTENATFDPIDNSAKSYLVDEGAITVTVNATAKSRFQTEGDRLIGGLGMNPLKTAWELIPYSLVVDWFIDVSSYLTAFGSSFSASFEPHLCYSVKTTGERNTYLVHDSRQELTFKSKDVSGGLVCSTLNMTRGLNYASESKTFGSEGKQLVRKQTYDDYERVLFSNRDIKLTFSPKLESWRRQLSAAALTWVSLPSVLRRLR